MTVPSTVHAAGRPHERTPAQETNISPQSYLMYLD